jgi:hypothetical protein
MDTTNSFADDLKEATDLIEEAFRLLIKYRKRGGKPLSYRERMRIKKFMGSVSGICILRGLLDVPAEFIV